jgi:hypothetical protein
MGLFGINQKNKVFIIMKKEILLEINRVHEIMGIKTKELLSEGPILRRLTKYFDDLFQDADAIKPIINDPGFFSVNGVRVSDGELRNIRALIDDPDLIDVAVSDAAGQKTLKTLGRILSKDTNKLEELYFDMFNDIFNQKNITENEFYKRVNELIKRGSSVDDELEKLFPNDPFTQSLFRPTFESKLNLYKKGELKPKLPKGIDPTTNKPWESPEYVSDYMAPELNRISKLYASAKDTSVVRFFRQTEPFWSMYFRKWWIGVFQAQNTNILKAKQLLNDAVTKIKANQDATRELEQALIQILLVRKKIDFDLTTIMNKFLKDNPDIPKENLEIFLNSKVVGNKKVSDLLDALNVSSREAASKAAGTTFKAYKELIPFLGWDKSSGLVDNVINTFKVPATRWINMATFKGPTTMFEKIVNSSLRGRNRELFAKVLEKALIYYLLVPGLISFWKTYAEKQVPNAAQFTLLKGFNDFCKNSVPKVDKLKNDETIKKWCKGIEKDLSEIEFVTSEDYINNYLNVFPKDFTDHLLYGATGSKIDDIWSVIGAPTWWDEIIKYGWDKWQSSIFPATGKPGESKAIEYLKTLKEKYRKELISLGIDPEASADEILKQLEKLGDVAKEKTDDVKKAADSLKTKIPQELDDNMKKLEIQKNFLGVDSLSKYQPLLDNNFGFKGVEYKDGNQYILKFKDPKYGELPIFRDPNDPQNKGWYFKEGNKKVYLKN